MPKLKTVTKQARDASTKKRVVKQPAAKPVVIVAPEPVPALVIASVADMLRETGTAIILPTESDIAEFAPTDTMPVHDNPAADPATALIPYVAPAAASKPAAKSAPIDTDRILARRAAKLAVSEFYAGASLPFKAAVDLQYRAAINFARFVPGTITGTERTAAALAAVLAYCTVAPDGSFVRGSGAVPRKLLGLTERPDETLRAGLESGVLSRLIGVGAIRYVSGATHGKQCDEAVYKLDYKAAHANMLAHNDKMPDGERRFGRPLALLDLTITERA